MSFNGTYKKYISVIEHYDLFQRNIMFINKHLNHTSNKPLKSFKVLIKNTILILTSQMI